MNLIYKRLGNGMWAVEAFVFVSDTEMHHVYSIHPDRAVASWDAVRQVYQRSHPSHQV